MKLNIYQRLLVFILPIVCISIFGVGYYSYLVARGEIVDQIRAQIQERAGDLGMEINKLCNQARIDLITISELTSIGDYYNNIEYELHNEAEICRKAIEKFMLRFSDRSRIYAGISYIDENGMDIARIVNNKVAGRRGDRGRNLFFKEAKGLEKEGIYVAAVEGGEGVAGLAMRYATPIFSDTGNFKGVVALDVDFRKIQDLIGAVRVGKAGHAYLINMEGVFLAHPEGERIMTSAFVPELNEITKRMTAGKEGWGEYSNEDGKRLVGYAPVGDGRWSVAVTAPLSDFMGKVNEIKINSTVATLFIILIAIFGILIIAESISKPIKKLVDSTRIVSNGDFDHRIDIGSVDEVGELARSFNEMVSRLKTSQEKIERWNDELEKRVRITTWQLKAEKDKLEAVFQSMADGVIVLDEFSRVTDLNPAAQIFLGGGRLGLIGQQILMGGEKSGRDEFPAIRSLQKICEPKFGKEYIRCWNYFNCQEHDCPAYESEEWRCWLLPKTDCKPSGHMQGNAGTKTEDCLKCEMLVKIRERYSHAKQTEAREVGLDMPKKDIRVFKTPMFDIKDRFLGNVIILQDITKDKELDRMKSEFISNVSHELRTPLSSIKSFSELLLDDLDAMDIETQRRFLGIISGEADRLTRLISDILDLQRITSKKMKWDMQNIQLSEIIESCINTFLGLAAKKNMNLSYECKGRIPLVQGDKDKLHQVLSNLISNALKFSGEQGQIEVEAEETPDGVLISVSDEGIGIPEDKMEKIFEKFYQVDGSATKERTGTGLGLAISREIIQHHGGRIWVESKVGEGSKFSFHLPKISEGEIPVVL